MNNSVRTYALSLYSLADEDGIDKLIYDELLTAADILNSNPEYINILDTAAFSGNEKDNLIDESFGKSIHIYIVNFLKILARKRMVYSFSECVRFYEKQYRAKHNIETAEIITAIAVSDEKKKSITEKLSQIYKKELITTFTVDSSLIGGIVVKFENSSIDTSVKSKLNELKSIISK